MERGQLTDLAEQILEAHKTNLLIDPFVKIKVEITKGDFVSKCISDALPMSWIIQLNPERHEDFFDTQYSILEGLLIILFDDLKLQKENSVDIQQRIIARLATAFCEIFSEEEEDDDED